MIKLAKHDKIKFDIEPIIDLIGKHTPTNSDSSKGLTGLAIQSYYGNVNEGFKHNHDMVPTFEYFDMDYCRKRKIYHWIDYNKPTELMENNAIKYIIDTLFKMKLNPTRARLVRVESGCGMKTHIDAVTKTQYAFKIHIPIITNSECILCVEQNEYHLELGFLYLFNQNSYHSVSNKGKTDRWHMIVDAYDEGNNFSIGACTNYDYHKKIADTWRKYVNGEIDEPKRLIIDA